MPNSLTLDFSLTVAAGQNNLKTLVLADSDIELPGYKWQMLMVTNTGANACTMRRSNSQQPSTTTNGRNLAAGATITIDTRNSGYIDGAGVWFYSSAGTTIDVSVVMAGA